MFNYNPNLYPFTNYHEINLDWLISQMAEIREAISRIPGGLTPSVVPTPEVLRLKKCLLIGDSYGEGGRQGAPAITNYGTYAQAFTGVKIYNLSESGAGFAKIGDRGHNFEGLLTTAPAELDRLEVTDIYVMGGFNDYLQTDTNIWQNMAAFRITANNLYPNAALHCGFIGMCVGAPDFDHLQNARHAYMKCANYGMQYMTGVEEVMLDVENHFDDNIHPNERGQIALGVALAQHIYGMAYTQQDARKEVALAGHNGITVDHSIYQTLSGSVGVVSAKETITFGNMAVFGSHRLDGSESFWVADMVRVGYVRGNEGAVQTVPGIVVLNNDSMIEASVTVILSNGGVNLRIIAVDGSQEFITATMKAVKVPPFSMAVNAFID